MGFFKNVFGKSEGDQSPFEITSDNWNFYYYFYGENDEFMAMISFDRSFQPEESRTDYLNGRRLIFKVPLEFVGENGILSGKENEKLTALEDVLISELVKARVACRFVGRMTYSGLKEFIFQVRDTDAFQKIVTDFIARKKSHYEVQVKEYEGWDFYTRKVLPDEFGEQQIASRQMIQTMLDAGSDPEKPHYFEHAFFGSAEGLQQIQKELLEEGFDLLSLENDRMRMAKSYSLDEEVIDETNRFMIMLSRLFNCRYDGWGAGIIR